MYKKIRHYVWTKESGFHGWKTMQTSLSFTSQKEIKWKASNKAVIQGVTVRFALTSAQPNEPSCLDHVTWDARSESSSGWLKHLHCQDSLCVAIPTKRRQSTRNGWLTLTLSALGRVHNTRSTLRWLMTNIGFGIRCNRLGAIPFAQDWKEVESWKENLKALSSSHHVCLSNLSASMWVLCRLEVCPYKPRGLSLLGQSVFD